MSRRIRWIDCVMGLAMSLTLASCDPGPGDDLDGERAAATSDTAVCAAGSSVCYPQGQGKVGATCWCVDAAGPQRGAIIDPDTLVCRAGSTVCMVGDASEGDSCYCIGSFGAIDGTVGPALPP